MAKGNAQLSGGRELSYVTQKDALFGSLIQRIISAINTIGANTAVSPTGKLPPPAPIDSISVQGTMNASTNTITVPSEHLHWTLTHNAAIQKGIQYISEIDTDPNFLQPHVIDHGCSRSGFVSLPATTDGSTPQAYYLRSYPQYHGSDPAPRTTLGGRDGATKIVLTPPTGAGGQTLLSSTGSGTASAGGQQGGKGLGTVLNRQPAGPKRNLIVRTVS